MLRKANAELLIDKGIEQKVSDFILPDESLARADNVDFSKVGVASKRSGAETNSTLVLDGGTLEDVRRLGVRARKEVVCISERTTQLGSAAGVGQAGDTLLSYSEQAQRWIQRGKMPRPNLDVIWTSGIQAAAGSVSFTGDLVCGGFGNYVCLAYKLLGADTKARVVVLDVGGDVGGPLLESPAVIVDTVIDTPGAIIGWYTFGGRVWLLVSGVVTSSVRYYFDPGALLFNTLPFTFSTEQLLAAGTDGVGVVTIHKFGTGVRLNRWDSTFDLAATNTWLDVAFAVEEVGMDARTSWVDVARHDFATGQVWMRRFDGVTLAAFTLSLFVTTGASDFGNIQVCTLNDQAIVTWANKTSATVETRPAYLSVGLMDMNTGALVGYFNHSSLIPYAQPFLIDGRCYMVAMHSTGYIRPNASPTDLTGSTTGEEAFLCLELPTQNLTPWSMPLPSAQWNFGRAAAKTLSAGPRTVWAHGRTIHQVSGAVYVLSNVLSHSGQSSADWVAQPQLVRLELGDATHRWRNRDFHDCTVFAGGTPFLYDGDRSYELGATLHQPIPVAQQPVSGGSLTADLKLFFRTAALYVDANGRECWSQPSRIVEVTPTGATLTAQVQMAPPTLSMKPDAGHYFSNRLKLYLFMATANAPNEWRVAANPATIDPFGLDVIGFTVSAPPPLTNTLMYTNGFELDNFPAPPCRAITAHSGRLVAISSDDNQAYYTKPARSTRGPEFALGQWIPLPDKGTACESLDDRLVIFTHRSILAVQGDGPDVTGTPPEAFSRPTVISPDYGCVEYDAARRTPLGIIFRGQQGFYLLNRGFEVQYIGGSVEDITRGWEATRSIVHDQKLSCCRITGYTGTRTEELCFWYDTKRWSRNLLGAEEFGTLVTDSVELNDNLLWAVSDTAYGVVSRYRLGQRPALVWQDFGQSYEQTLETGWVTFNQAGQFKRVWRVYALVRAATTGNQTAAVRMEIFKDWEETVSSDREFLLTSQDSEPRNLRIHLKHQKIKAVKVRVTVRSEGAGVDVMKVGFEIGMREGGPKEQRKQSQ